MYSDSEIVTIPKFLFFRQPVDDVEFLDTYVIKQRAPIEVLFVVLPEQ